MGESLCHRRMKPPAARLVDAGRLTQFEERCVDGAAWGKSAGATRAPPNNASPQCPGCFCWALNYTVAGSGMQLRQAGVVMQ